MKTLCLVAVLAVPTSAESGADFVRRDQAIEPNELRRDSVQGCAEWRCLGLDHHDCSSREYVADADQPTTVRSKHVSSQQVPEEILTLFCSSTATRGLTGTPHKDETAQELAAPSS